MPIFQYDPYRNAYGPSIAEALAHANDAPAQAALRIGDLQAQGAERTAALQGQLWNQLGSIPAQIAASNEAAQKLALQKQQSQLVGQQIQEGALTLQDAQAQHDADRQLSTIFANTPRNADGTYDTRAFINNVPPELTKYAGKWVQQANAITDTWLADDARRKGTVQASALALLQAGAPFQATQGLIDSAHRDRVLTDDQATQYKNQLVEDPKGAPTVLRILGGYKKPITKKDDESLLDAATLGTLVPSTTPRKTVVVNGQVVDAETAAPIGKAIPPQAPARSPEQIALDQARVKEIEAKLNGTTPVTPAEQQRLTLEWAKLREQQTQDGAAPALSDAGLALTAHQYAMTGQLPPMGMGKQGAAVRTAIINKAADVYQGLDLPSQMAAYKANQHSLTQLQGTADKVSAFEATAGKNLDQFLALADKIPDTGVPWLNLPVRMLTKEIVGNDNMAAATAARDVALREIARVTNDPNLSGVLSDSARREVSALSPENATLGQIKAVAKVLRQDMANVHGSLTDQIGDIQRRIATPPGGPPPAAATPSSTPKTDPLGLF